MSRQAHGEPAAPVAPTVLLGVCGGIAAYKAAEVVRRLRDLGADVTVCPTANALRFVGEPTWAALSGRPVLDSLWQRAHEVAHVSAARAADVILVAPATADMLARLAQGRSDDVLSSVVLMAACPVIIAPAMHSEMWVNPATQHNVSTLRQRGMLVLEPADGRLTGPDSGPGRLPAPESLAEVALSSAAHPGRDLLGCHVVVTAGGTREPLDPVRWIGNRSSGRMGYAVATAAVARGAQVTVIAANVNLPDVAGARVVHADTHANMQDATLEVAATADVLVMAAAVADFAGDAQTAKIKKADPAQPLHLALRPTGDILSQVIARRVGARPFVVGFAAETASDGLLELAHDKLHRKGCDVIVANDVSGGAVFGEADTAAVVVTRAGHAVEISRQPKLAAAHIILDAAAAGLR